MELVKANRVPCIGDQVLSNAHNRTKDLYGIVRSLKWDEDGMWCLVYFGVEFDGHNGNIDGHKQDNYNNWWVLSEYLDVSRRNQIKTGGFF